MTPELFVASVLKNCPVSFPVYIGVDPGSQGAIGYVCGKLQHGACDIPVMKVARTKKKQTVKYNYPAILEIFGLFRQLRGRVIACVETGVVFMPGPGSNAYTGFRCGYSIGMWPLFLVAQGYALEECTPMQWKKEFALKGKDKEASRHKAQALFPRAELARKKDHDRAEALLIAEYARRIRK